MTSGNAMPVQDLEGRVAYFDAEVLVVVVVVVVEAAIPESADMPMPLSIGAAETSVEVSVVVVVSAGFEQAATVKDAAAAAATRRWE
ncbi:MAG TPA: hypothetical protein VG839_07395 [Asticcacaulis sp.]|nr:hypothetical protein [Asticcacaulis sp.]